MMQKTTAIQTPHDAIFKQFLADPATIKDFIELHLPQELQAICNLNTLRLLPGSFIEDNLRPYYSDVLYSLQTTEGEGYLHILIEHQSTPDKHMAFRLMRYSIAAMQQHLKTGHDRLPLVIPVLFYAGKRSPYPYSLNWLEDFENPTLAGKIYGGNFILVDVTAIPDEEIMQHRSMAALTLLQKHIHQRELAAFSDKLAATLLTDFLSSEQLKLLINYIVQAGETEEAERLIRELAEKVPQHGEELMTIAQQLEQKGFEKGMEQGIQQGIEQGIEKGIEKGIEQGCKEKALQIARLLLQKGVSQTLISETTGISTDELTPLQQ
ncbi:Rpn family recombination-promoting nuclease/putative transposase [Kalamiella sp. sgz302252]|uniref:Rpn family recombination-promoting nuclease/putative transposase n=1 Tax=Pantoea sp. sgz302252 TaxID=3341827 RepID=UPI0036D32B4B